jgi:hypothetical protein
MPRGARWRFGVVLVAAMTGCASPEATRARGAGPGADPGNRGAVVTLHEGAEPYYRTPRIVMSGEASARRAEAGAK